MLEGILFIYYGFAFCICNDRIRLLGMYRIKKRVCETLHLVYHGIVCLGKL